MGRIGRVELGRELWGDMTWRGERGRAVVALRWYRFLVEEDVFLQGLEVLSVNISVSLSFPDSFIVHSGYFSILSAFLGWRFYIYGCVIFLLSFSMLPVY